MKTKGREKQTKQFVKWYKSKLNKRQRGGGHVKKKKRA